MTTGWFPSCTLCKHYWYDDPRATNTQWYCAAFPDGTGIPLSIRSGADPHNEPLEDELTFELLDDREEDLERLNDTRERWRAAGAFGSLESSPTANR